MFSSIKTSVNVTYETRIVDLDAFKPKEINEAISNLKVYNQFHNFYIDFQ